MKTKSSKDRELATWLRQLGGYATMTLVIRAGSRRWGSVARLAGLSALLVAGVLSLTLASPVSAACVGIGPSGTLQVGEQCDDGNVNNSDDCLNDCTVPTCGDGFVHNQGSGTEECDDGNASDTDGCVDLCKWARCGDGFSCAGGTCAGSPYLAGPEACDDGNGNNNDACPDGTGGTCAPATCSDAFTWNVGGGTEQCDDGNGSNNDACRNDCQNNVCHDGVTNPAAEQCDDGNTVNTDNCVGACVWARCGDGFKCSGGGCSTSLFLDGPEACDTAGESATCDDDCTAVSCGDQNVNQAAGEQCDDANTETRDNCPYTGTDPEAAAGLACKSASCGDGATHIIGSSPPLPPPNPETCDEGFMQCTGGIRDGLLCLSSADCPGGACTTPVAGGLLGAGNSNDPNFVGCRTNCQPSRCGDGIEDANAPFFEECDNGAGNNSNSSNAICRPDCSDATCGDAIVDNGAPRNEQCDDGNGVNDDGCTNVCSTGCGNGVTEASLGEECDDGDTDNGDACDNQCRNNSCGDGDVTGDEECDDDNAFNTDACLNNCEIAACGDGFVQIGVEECDLGQATCQGGANGGAPCTLDAQCASNDCGSGNANNDFDPCHTNCMAGDCGNGIVDAGEQCDDANGSNLDSCLNDCDLNVCGDGFREEGVEECDDGNLANGDDCRNDCMLNVCGDGIVNVLGEQPEACDDGASLCSGGPLHGEPCDFDSDCAPGSCVGGNRNSDGLCKQNCTFEICGDGFVDGAEDCDDGNSSNADACLTAATSPATTCHFNVCGDGFTNPAAEVCDDDNTANGDGCRGDCLAVEGCGDGVEQAGLGETCDDNNTVTGDGCDAACHDEVCPDGITTLNEECDDDNFTNTDGCPLNCVNAECGDGNVCSDAATCHTGPNGGVEQCDNAGANSNTVPNACRMNCANPSCGDGVQDGGEACDDGNESNNDLCVGACVVATCGDAAVCSNASCTSGPGTGPEECDAGPGNSNITPNACRTSCAQPSCGDGVTDPGFGENCDGGAGCAANCCAQAGGGNDASDIADGAACTMNVASRAAEDLDCGDGKKVKNLQRRFARIVERDVPRLKSFLLDAERLSRAMGTAENLEKKCQRLVLRLSRLCPEDDGTLMGLLQLCMTQAQQVADEI
jgi:cysteine-rich repeat protein